MLIKVSSSYRKYCYWILDFKDGSTKWRTEVLFNAEHGGSLEELTQVRRVVLNCCPKEYQEFVLQCYKEEKRKK